MKKTSKNSSNLLGEYKLKLLNAEFFNFHLCLSLNIEEGYCEKIKHSLFTLHIFIIIQEVCQCTIHENYIFKLQNRQNGLKVFPLK